MIYITRLYPMKPRLMYGVVMYPSSIRKSVPIYTIWKFPYRRNVFPGNGSHRWCASAASSLAPWLSQFAILSCRYLHADFWMKLQDERIVPELFALGYWRTKHYYPPEQFWKHGFLAGAGGGKSVESSRTDNIYLVGRSQLWRLLISVIKFLRKIK